MLQDNYSESNSEKNVNESKWKALFELLQVFLEIDSETNKEKAN